MIISRLNHRSLVEEDFAPDRVVVDLRNGQYYCLNESAAFIWCMLQPQGRSLERICDDLSRRFILDAPTARAEIESYILLMETANLLVVDRAATTDGLPANGTETTSPLIPWLTPGFTTYTELEDLLMIDPIHEVDDKAGWPNPPAGNSPT